MKKVLFIILFIFFYVINTANSGELYKCVDSDGNEIITSYPKDGMSNCVLKDSYEEPAVTQKQMDREYYEQEKARTNQERARADQERARAEQEKEKAETLRKRKTNPECERECKIDRSSCESDCRRNIYVKPDTLGSYELTACTTNCLNYQKSCIDRCYY